MSLAIDFEAQLEAEGLAPLDAGGIVSSEHHRPRHDDSAAASGDAWQAWARHVLATAPFTSEHQRRVWRLYADGRSITEIQRALREDPAARSSKSRQEYRPPRARRGRRRTQLVGVSRRSVTLALERVRNLVPLPPVPNPRRRSGRERSVSVALRGKPLESLVRKVLAKLKRTAADGRELVKLLEVHMAEPKGTVRYERIRLREPMELPGRAVSKDNLLNVEGRPHAGGIDVVLAGEALHDKKGRRRTIPWWNIKHADVLTEAE